MITIEISPGEFMDRLTILAIKSERITDASKLRGINNTLNGLLARESEAFPPDFRARVQTLRRRLKIANAAIWDVQERLRHVDWSDERAFAPLARVAHEQNDERFRIKREIDELMGSELSEEKSYL